MSDRNERDAVLLRQLDIVKPDKLEEVHFDLIGAGGIGSFIGRDLAQMGAVDVRVFDPDTVEVHNRPSQAYGLSMVGWPKGKALAELMMEHRTNEDLKVEVVSELVGPDTELRGIVIEAVDSLEARKEIWQAVKMKLAIPLFIDARMGGEVGQIRAVTPFKPVDIRHFEQSLEGKPEELPCTAAAVIYNGSGIAALVLNLVKRFVMGETVPRELILSFPDLEYAFGGFSQSMGLTVTPEWKE